MLCEKSEGRTTSDMRSEWCTTKVVPSGLGRWRGLSEPSRSPPTDISQPTHSHEITSE